MTPETKSILIQVAFGIIFALFFVMSTSHVDTILFMAVGIGLLTLLPYWYRRKSIREQWHLDTATRTEKELYQYMITTQWLLIGASLTFFVIIIPKVY